MIIKGKAQNISFRWRKYEKEAKTKSNLKCMSNAQNVVNYKKY